jgi:sugar lactone lactonase YvrE
VSTLAGNGTGAWRDGTGAGACFNRPRGIASLPGSGVIYVADAWNHRIRMITLSGVTSTFAGSGSPAWVNGQGTSASFNWPLSLAVDPAGTVYVMDTSNHRVRKITPTGTVTTFAGTGAAAFSDGIGTISASFNVPRGIAVDSSGKVYVGDSFNNRIRLVFPNGTVSTFAGSGVAAWTDGVGTRAAFSYPTYLSSAANGNVIVSDSSNNVLRMITPLGLVTTIAGDGAASSLDGYGTTSRFSAPAGVSVSSTGAVFIGDFSNNRVRKLTCVPYPPCPASYYCVSGVPLLCPAGYFCPPLSTAPIPCTGPPGYGCAPGSAVNATACIPGYFCPGGTPALATPCMTPANCAAVGLSAEPPCVWNVTTLAGSGNAAFANGQGSAASFNRPAGVAVDTSGLVYVADGLNHRIRVVSPTGLVSTLAGSGTAAWADGTGAAASFNLPRGVAILPGSGVVYVADAWNYLIRAVALSGMTTTLAGSGTLGFSDGQGPAASFN